ncbi:MAG TPA: dTDP-4-dehydrorhamnose 3,5-epimerase [Anaerolineales bacterium]|nr:dTDP-4-dehydrorhamnose 3,5-epimerase [Anaerolineales bacterium]
MNIKRIPSSDIYLIEPQIYKDERGFFMESFHESKFIELGIHHTFVQENRAGSHRGVLRGLHYQIQHAQGKLVQVLLGEVFDVAVDLRRSSPMFGKPVCLRLSAESKCQLWIPPGFAHGYYVLSEWAEVAYKATDFYAPEMERTLLWNDPQLRIEWPLLDNCAPILSSKDTRGKLLVDCDTYGELSRTSV